MAAYARQDRKKLVAGRYAPGNPERLDCFICENGPLGSKFAYEIIDFQHLCIFPLRVTRAQTNGRPNGRFCIFTGEIEVAIPTQLQGH
jgi:hypothetical protein